MSVEPFTNFVKRKAVNNRLNASDPQYGLCLKTYNSDYIVTGLTQNGLKAYKE